MYATITEIDAHDSCRMSGSKSAKISKLSWYEGLKSSKPLLNKLRKEESEPKDSASNENLKTQQANGHTSMTQSNCICASWLVRNCSKTVQVERHKYHSKENTRASYYTDVKGKHPTILMQNSSIKLSFSRKTLEPCHQHSSFWLLHDPWCQQRLSRQCNQTAHEIGKSNLIIRSNCTMPTDTQC